VGRERRSQAHGGPQQKRIGIVTPINVVKIDKARRDKLLRA